MHNRLLILICVISLTFPPQNTFAQDKVIDSLRTRLSTKNLPDTDRIKTMLALGDRLGYSDGALARKYLDSAYTIATARHLYMNTGDALTSIAQAFYRSNDLDTALVLLQRADTVYGKADSNKAKGALISSKMNIATILRTMGDFSTAIAMYLKGVDAMEKADIPDKRLRLMTAYMNIGLVYNEFNEYDRSLYYHRKALALVNHEVANDIKTYYLRLHRIHDFIALKQFDSARHYLQTEDSLYHRLGQKDILSQFYSNRGLYYLGIKQEDSALQAFQQAYEYAQASNNQFRQVQMLSRLGDIYRNKKEYRKSADLLEKASALSHTLGDKPGEMNIAKSLSAIYATDLHDDHRAVGHFLDYVRLSDTLNESASRHKVNELESAHRIQRKEDSIAELRRQGQLQGLLLRRTKALSTTLIAGSLLLLLLAVFIIVNYKRKHQFLEQAKELQESRILEMEKQHQIVAMQSMLKGQEEERSRLARDLHDGVGGLLSGIKLSLNGIKGNVYLPEQSAQSIGNVIHQLDNSISELRRVSHNMMPEALILYGLKEALENYCANINISGSIKVQLQTYGMEQRLEQSVDIVLYRIVQELLTNVIRHSRAENVLVQLIRKQDRFSLTVEDDGIGFESLQPNRATGAGLANVKARAEYLGGTVDIHSTPGQGTSVNIEGSCV
jgi:two-component system NarL family sensor kinase